MTGILRGRHEVRLDSKGRLCLPSNFRQSLAADESEIEFVITNSQVQGQPCLDAYLIAEWEKLEAEVSGLPRFNKEVLSFRRFYLACGQQSRLDGQNRLLVPGQLREFAQLSGDIVLLGMGRKFEIWSSAIWQELHTGLADNFENVLEQVSNLNVGIG